MNCIMKLNIAIRTALLLFVAALSALNLHASIQEADKAYANDEFPKAIQLYLQTAANEGTSPSLFYNLGNAYYRDGQLGKAILNYNRALKLDPTYADALTNLEFVNTKIIDKPVDNDSLTDKVTNKIITFLNPNQWAYTTAALFLIMILCAAGYIFLNSVKLRKASFFTALILLFATIAGIIISINAANRQLSHNDAIITAESVQLSTSPRQPKDKSEEAMLLHEGTLVNIIDSLKVQGVDGNPTWYEVTVNKEHRAWINAANLERI